MRTSGEALIRNHRRWSALTATDDWVRGTPAPERTAVHTGQPQFHCGEPPPAAEPSTRSHILAPLSCRTGGRRTRGPAPVTSGRCVDELVLHLGDVHGHLRRDSDLVEIGRLP